MTASPDPPLLRLDPKIDFVFQALFGSERNRDLLLSFLNGVLELEGADRITEIQNLSPISAREYPDEKETILDLTVRDAAGRQYCVEMQCRSHRAFPERMLYYAARRYTDQLRTSDAYTRLKPVVLIVITDFVLFPNDPHWQDTFQLRSEHHEGVFSNHLKIVLIELPKFHKHSTEADTLGERWVTFLKEGLAMQTQDTQGRPWETPEFLRAKEELERMAGDENMRAQYERRLLQMQLWATEVEEHYDQGLEKGIEQGIEKGIEQGIEKGIEQGRRTVRAMVLKLIRLRFHELPEPIVARVEAASDSELEQWMERALVATSIAEVFE